MAEQHHILSKIGSLLEDLWVENLKKTHWVEESGKAIGKTVLEF